MCSGPQQQDAPNALKAAQRSQEVGTAGCATALLTRRVLMAVSASVNLWGACPSTCASHPRFTMFQSACACCMNKVKPDVRQNNGSLEHARWHAL